MITKLGKDSSYMLFGASGNMEQNERVHISKGTKIYAFGYGMSQQYFVVCDDNMNAVEICNGNPDEVDEYDLGRYFHPTHKLEETTRPISKKFGIGFYYDESDEVISDDVIERSLKRAENLEKLEKDIKERKKKEAEETRERLLKEFSYLQLVTQRFDHKICGQNIRTELKRNFPSVKFSVRYESFSGNNAYSISWTDGPTTGQVDKIVKKYGDMHPDSYSMGDYWDCAPSIFNNLYGSVGYVTTNRSKSDDAIIKLMTDNNIDRDEACNLYWKTDLTPKEEPKTKEVVSGSFEIIDYSEKAIALIGDTKSIKEQLKKLGGRFNGKLSCGPGWIFSKKSREAVEALIS